MSGHDRVTYRPSFKLEHPVYRLPHTSATYSERHKNILKLVDLMHLALLRGDNDRARQAMSILLQCSNREFSWQDHWRIMLSVMDKSNDRLVFLRALQRRLLSDREELLQEIVLELISNNETQDALDELETSVSHPVP